MAKAKIGTIRICHSKLKGQYFIRIEKNGRKIAHSETYKNLSHANKMADFLHGGRADMEIVRFKIR